MGKFIDLTGQRFGRLVVIERDFNYVYEHNIKNKNTVYWKCQCDCGNFKSVDGHLLKRGITKSCGCLKSQLITNKNCSRSNIEVGTKFGQLTYLKDLGYRKQNSRNKKERWGLCQCSCGRQLEVSHNNLKSGGTKSCGCVNSRGEFIISQILQENNINFSTQYTFQDLRGIKNGLLRFDFAIFDDNNKLIKLIEFDGRQHVFGPAGKWTQSYSKETLQEHDRRKDEYCKNHNIPLLRIPYCDINKLSKEYLQL